MWIVILSRIIHGWFEVKCFYCDAEACAKIGGAKGNIWNALLGRKAWDKREKYVCREHFERTIEQEKVM